MSIINKDSIEDHTVQRYRFKVLGTPLSETMHEEMHDEQEHFEETLVPITEALIPQDDGPRAAKVEESHHAFVEELLKKTDELTTHVVKLQLQIEKQETEFNHRLTEALGREREAAHAQGYQKAKEEMEAHLNESKSRYFASIEKLDALLQKQNERYTMLESQMSSTAIDIAKEVIQKEISHHSTAIALSLSKTLLGELKEASSIELKAHPKDVEALKEAYANQRAIKVSADDAIAPGGVILLSDNGNLDGSLSMRLEKVKHLLQENET